VRVVASQVTMAAVVVLMTSSSVRWAGAKPETG
jgi:hypothetical protein